MWADIERFGIDDLLEDDQPGAGRRRRPFAVQVPRLSSIPVHWHDYYELGHVLEGTARHVLNGRRHPIGPGATFLLSPADVHALEVPDGAAIVLVNAVLDPGLVERVLESVVPAGDVGLPWIGEELPALAGLAQRVSDETMARRAGWDVVVESALRTILVELARAHAGSGVSADDTDLVDVPADIRRAVRFVERHFREPLTLAQVAAVAHLSPNWFSEQFRRTTGESFQSYLRRRRVQFARALLDATPLSVTEVSQAAGFNDPSYFARVFRAQYGTPPSQRPQAARTA